MKKIGIIGMGALGVLYAHFFYDSLGPDSVAFILDDKRYQKHTGKTITFNEKKYSFLLETPNQKEHYDLIIFAVKGPSLFEAIELAKEVATDDTLFISVLNGISSEEYLETAFGRDRLIHSVALGMDTLKEGYVVSSAHFGKLHIGYLGTELENFQSLVDLFQVAKVPFLIDKDIKRRLWSKWMLNIGVNQVVMLTEGTYKTIQSKGDERSLMIDAMKEVVELSQLEGVNLTTDDIQYYLDIVDGLNPSSMPSMRQDGLFQRNSEVELFAGTLLKLARKHNLKTPINEMLYNKIKHIEESY